LTDRAKTKERDEVLKRMLKMKPKPHGKRVARPVKPPQERKVAGERGRKVD
jgi:hypothetical protein